MKLQPKAVTEVYLPDQRGVVVSRYGKANSKIGNDVYTYSRPAGREGPRGTCPGSTDECEAICYAKRIGDDAYRLVYVFNTGDNVPPIPTDARWLRLHVSGDFDTVGYVEHWTRRLSERPDVTAWAYTRSWRVPELLAPLEALRALPNVQLFASMDPSTVEVPPLGWRTAWIEGDPRLHALSGRTWSASTGATAYTCPEETGHKRDCRACRYCLDGRRGDVVFLRH